MANDPRRGQGHDPADHDHAAHDHAGHDHAAHGHAEHGHAEHGHAEHDHAGHGHAEHGHAPAVAAGASGHGHDHGHAHGHLRTPGNERRLVAMLVLVVGYIFVELFGGLWSGSLALLADAGHMTSDAAALAIALFALRMARRPPTATRTYGFHRAEVIAAVVNGGALVAVALGILWEAWQRLAEPAPVAGPLMMAVAAGGLLVNLVGLAVLAGGRHQDMNLRGAWLHVLSDALGSVGALVAGALVWWKGWTWADPLASAAIALLVLHASWALLNEALHVLMEGAPPHIDVDQLRAAMCGTPGVHTVHDLHVWTITSGMVALSCHVVVDGTVDGHELLGTLATSMRVRFAIGHTTIQLEPLDFQEEGFHP